METMKQKHLFTIYKLHTVENSIAGKRVAGCWLLKFLLFHIVRCWTKVLALKYLFFFQLDVLDKFGVEFFLALKVTHDS